MFDRIHQFRALIHNPQATKADLATFAALAFGVPDLEGTHPSEATLAAYTRQDRQTVRKSLHHLHQLGQIRMERRFAGRRVIGTLYHFPKPVSVEDSATHHAAPMDEAAPIGGGNASLAMGETTAPIDLPDLTDRTGRPVTDKRVGVIDLEAEQLARHLQQSSAGPWRLDNARRATHAAIAKAGIDEVRRVAQAVRGQGLRAYEITARLDAIGGADTAPPLAMASTPASAAAPATAAPASPLIRRALVLLDSECPSKRMSWYSRAVSAGCTALMAQTAAWVPLIATPYMEAEHWREWQELAA